MHIVYKHGSKDPKGTMDWPEVKPGRKFWSRSSIKENPLKIPTCQMVIKTHATYDAVKLQ